MDVVSLYMLKSTPHAHHDLGHEKSSALEWWKFPLGYLAQSFVVDAGDIRSRCSHDIWPWQMKRCEPCQICDIFIDLSIFNVYMDFSNGISRDVCVF